MRLPHIRNLELLCTVILLLAQCAGGEEAAKPADLRDDPITSPRTQWFREAKFGMFIHWGLYAVPAGVWKGKDVGGIGEWIMNNAKIPIPEYEPLAKEFNPVRFDAKEWVRVAKDAGMRYIVITSKHHDGFCMFDTQLTDYSIVAATPYKKDPMKDLAAACKEAGVKFCFYHSIMDWHHPDQNRNFPKYKDYLFGQVKELLTHYGPIGILWFDGEWIGPWNNQLGRELYDHCRTLQPDLIINNRVGKRDRSVGDYDTPEQEIPSGAKKGQLWETCMTLNDTWGYKLKDHHWKPPADVVHKLADIASKGGNFLLNVGPTAEGVIPEKSVEILAEVGKWMKVNGDSIYGTVQSPWKRHTWDGRATVKGKTLYLHVFKWPAGALKIAGLKGEIVGVQALDPAVRLGAHEVARDGDRATLTIPTPEKPDPLDTVVVVQFKDAFELDAGSAVPKQADDGTVSLTGTDAALQGGTIQYESGGGKDCIGFWLKQEDWVSWDFVLAKPGTYEVAVTWACEDGVGGSDYVVAVGGQQVKTQVKDTGGWGTFKTETIGSVKLEQPGKLTLSVKATSKPKLAVMNLRSVVLKPAK